MMIVMMIAMMMTKPKSLIILIYIKRTALTLGFISYIINRII